MYPTQIDDIKKARNLLDTHYTNTAKRVEIAANDPDVPDANRVMIVHSAGLEVKGESKRKARTFDVVHGDVSGTVKLTAAGKANSHEWRYTEDVINFTNRMEIDSTSAANTEVTGLTKGKEYAFFHNAVKPGKKTEWEGPILLVVV